MTKRPATAATAHQACHQPEQVCCKWPQGKQIVVRSMSITLSKIVQEASQAALSASGRRLGMPCGTCHAMNPEHSHRAGPHPPPHPLPPWSCALSPGAAAPCIGCPPLQRPPFGISSLFGEFQNAQPVQSAWCSLPAELMWYASNVRLTLYLSSALPAACATSQHRPALPRAKTQPSPLSRGPSNQEARLAMTQLHDA